VNGRALAFLSVYPPCLLIAASLFLAHFCKVLEGRALGTALHEAQPLERGRRARAIVAMAMFPTGLWSVSRSIWRGEDKRADGEQRNVALCNQKYGGEQQMYMHRLSCSEAMSPAMYVLCSTWK
jgi:hypothetical protein